MKVEWLRSTAGTPPSVYKGAGRASGVVTGSAPTARVALKDYAGAIADHTAVIQLTPRYWRSYFLRGTLYTLQRNWEAAIADFTGAIERNPEFSEVYRYRAEAYMGLGNKAAAEADLKEWVELGGRR